jgi:hypothetical protein
MKTTTAEMTEDRPTPRFAPTARELYYSGSGQTPPSPTEDEIAAAIRYELSHALRGTVLEEPLVKAALTSAARAVRALFPSNEQPKDQN